MFSMWTSSLFINQDRRRGHTIHIMKRNKKKRMPRYIKHSIFEHSTLIWPL